MSDTISPTSTPPSQNDENPPVEGRRGPRLHRPAHPFQEGLTARARLTSGLIWAVFFALCYAIAYLVTFALLVD